jgi:CheY-like chemotaxis protein
MPDLVKIKEKTINILLIEDNPDDVFLIQLAAKECNINGSFTISSNGRAALMLLEEIMSGDRNPPDMILLDVNLPKVTGLEVLKHIKNGKTTCSIPIVVFTSSDSMADMKYCYENGADLFIRKPNSINGFREIVQYIKSYCFGNYF